jgi:hypothetical protein
MSHTKGPWSRNIRANGKYPVVFAGRNQHVATVCQQKDGAETEANIDLVHAAPCLLEALEEYQRLVAYLQRTTNPEEWATRGDWKLLQARAAAAIAKAKPQG